MSTYILYVLSDLRDSTDVKQKLTLGISKSVIDRAKKAGINISAITEELLSAITYQPSEGNTDRDVIAAYEALFNAMDPMLDAYNIELEIGEYTRSDTHTKQIVKLNPIVGLISEEPSGDQTTAVKLVEIIRYLYHPTKILNNFVTDLISCAEANKAEIDKLKMALRFVKALSDEEETNITESSSKRTLHYSTKEKVTRSRLHTATKKESRIK